MPRDKRLTYVLRIMEIEEKSKNMNDIQNTGSDNRQGHVKFNGIYCAVTGIMIEANATGTGE